MMVIVWITCPVCDGNETIQIQGETVLCTRCNGKGEIKVNSFDPDKK